MKFPLSLGPRWQIIPSFSGSKSTGPSTFSGLGVGHQKTSENYLRYGRTGRIRTKYLSAYIQNGLMHCCRRPWFLVTERGWNTRTKQKVVPGSHKKLHASTAWARIPFLCKKERKTSNKPITFFEWSPLWQIFSNISLRLMPFQDCLYAVVSETSRRIAEFAARRVRGKSKV